MPKLAVNFPGTTEKLGNSQITELLIVRCNYCRKSMVVQRNMHPQVVEKVKAGKPYIFFSPPQEHNTGNCIWLESGKNL